MKRSRAEKYQDFQEFLSRSNAIFTSIATQDADHNFYDQRYSLCIVPGGWNGGIDKRILEVFYGARPYDSYSNVPAVQQGESTAAQSTSSGFHVERGARLIYSRTARGNVNCTLVPAKAESEKSTEDAIQLQRGLSPRELLDGKLPSKHWSYFMAYMKVTSLDGDPSLHDYARVAYVRLVKKRFRDGTDVSPRLFTWCGQVAKWVFTVGLSGALLSVITTDKSSKSVSLDSVAFHSLQSLLDEGRSMTEELAKTRAALVSINSSIEEQMKASAKNQPVITPATNLSSDKKTQSPHTKDSHRNITGSGKQSPSTAAQ